MIQVVCDCGSKIKVKDEFAGRTGRCRRCGEPLQIPEIKPDEESVFELPLDFAAIAESASDRPLEVEPVTLLQIDANDDEWISTQSQPALVATELVPPRTEPSVANSSLLWTYKMVQLAPTIEVALNQASSGKAADYLSEIVNDEAEQGWEFFRVDAFGISVPPGCLGAMFGARNEYTQYYVATFRKQV